MLTPKLQRIVGLAVILGGLLVLGLGSWTTLHERQLAARGVEISAKLVSVQHRASDSETGNQVNYRFEVAGQSYQHLGVFGPVSTDITAEALERAQSSGVVAVRYVPDNPGVNALVDHPGPSGGRGPIALGIGALMLLGGCVRIALSRRSSDAPRL